MKLRGNSCRRRRQRLLRASASEQLQHRLAHAAHYDAQRQVGEGREREEARQAALQLLSLQHQLSQPVLVAPCAKSAWE